MIGRGDVWTVAGGGYAGKPRPAVIIQNDIFSDRVSATICLLTTIQEEYPLFRIRIAPASTNGLSELSYCMVDKITTVRNDQLGHRIGRLTAEEMQRLGQAIALYLGLGEPAP